MLLYPMPKTNTIIFIACPIMYVICKMKQRKFHYNTLLLNIIMHIFLTPFFWGVVLSAPFFNVINDDFTCDIILLFCIQLC